MEKILDNPEAKDKDKLNAVKLMLEASGRMANRNQKVVYADKELQSMDEAEIKGFLERQGVRIDFDVKKSTKQTNVIDAETIDD